MRIFLLFAFVIYSLSASCQCTCITQGPNLITNGDFEDTATVITATSFTGFQSDQHGTKSTFANSWGILYWATNPKLVFTGGWSCDFTGTGHFLLADCASDDNTNLAIAPYDIIRYPALPVVKGRKYILEFTYTNAGTLPPDTAKLIFNKDTLSNYIFSSGCGTWDTIAICWTADTNSVTIRLNGGFATWNGRDVCLDNFSLRTCSGLGIAPVQNAISDYQVYPNPVTDQLNISFSAANDKETVVMELYNILGERVDELITQTSIGKQTITINTHNLLPGIYTCKFKYGENTIVTKIMK